MTRKLLIILLLIAVNYFVVPVVYADYNSGIRALKQKDYNTAYIEFKAAAENGHRVAQYHLGYLYHSGTGWIRITIRL